MVDKAVGWHAGKAADWERMRLGVGKYTVEKQRLALEALDARGGESILDLGTGSGFFARAAARNGAHVFAIDAAESMLRVALEIAGKEGVSINAVKADAGHVPFRDGAFDKTIAIDLIGHLSDPSGCIAEVGRVTRGRTVIAWPHSRSPYRLKYFMEKRLLHRTMPFTRWLSVPCMARMLTDAGFATKNIKTSLGVTAVLKGEKE